MRLRWSEQDIENLINATNDCRNKVGKIDWQQVSKRLNRAAKSCKTYYQYYREKLQQEKNELKSQQINVVKQYSLLQKLILYFLLAVYEMKPHTIEKYYFKQLKIQDKKELTHYLGQYIQKLKVIRKNIQHDFQNFLQLPWYHQEQIRVYVNYCNHRKQILNKNQTEKQLKTVQKNFEQDPVLENQDLIFSKLDAKKQEKQFIEWLDHIFTITKLSILINQYEEDITQVTSQILNQMDI